MNNKLPVMDSVLRLLWVRTGPLEVYIPCLPVGTAMVGPGHHSAEKVLILTMFFFGEGLFQF
jgi:hypothetical protein